MKTKKKYNKPFCLKVIIDKQISMVLMTSEGTPPGGPFGSDNIKIKTINKPTTPYKA